jgi:transposase-like protein
VVQTCIVHLTRASPRWVNYKDRKRVAAQLRQIYAAPTEQAARDALDTWTDSDIGRRYPAIKRQWETAWEQVIPFFAFRRCGCRRAWAWASSAGSALIGGADSSYAYVRSRAGEP